MRKRSKEEGLTLFEVVITIVVLAVAICGSLALFIHCFNAIARTRNMVQAVNEANSRLEELRCFDYASIISYDGVSTPVDNLTSGTATVSAVETTPGLIEASVTVTWQAIGGGTRDIVLSTLIASRY